MKKAVAKILLPKNKNPLTTEENLKKLSKTKTPNMTPTKKTTLNNNPRIKAIL